MTYDHLLENLIAMGFDGEEARPVLIDSADRIYNKPAHQHRSVEHTHHLAVWLKDGQKPVYDQLALQAKKDGVLGGRQGLQEYLRLWLQRILLETAKTGKVPDPRHTLLIENK